MLFLLIFGGLALCQANFPPRDPAAYSNSFRKTSKTLKSGSLSYKWSEEWFDGVPVDHFSFANKDSFSLRFFINTASFVEGGPILFYTGNEGKLEGFAENTGFMFDLAPELGAAVVFAEHRYYGKTQPYKNESYSSIDRLGYLSSEQAIADFVLLIDYLKTQRIRGATNSAVIAFGGSYGGMLAAWIRTKYPHKVDGAIASSAPVFWFADSNIPEGVYSKIVTRSFVESGCNANAVVKGWIALMNLARTARGRKYLNDLFKLEPKSRLINPKDYWFLATYIKQAFEAMAVVNYPYPTSFLSPLPAWPVKKACKFLRTVATSDEEAARQLYEVVNIYYNSTGNVPSLCADASKCDGGYAVLGNPLGWPFQYCTEMVMPICGLGPPNDFFWKDCPWTVEATMKMCNRTLGDIGYTSSMLRPHWTIQNYGNKFPTASNIVFSNGYLDPWSGGGWSMKDKVEGSLVSIILTHGAHHYDLRGAHKDDTEEVKKVRATEKQYIKKWIEEAKRKNNRTH